jgi:hypothetical protein
MEFTRQLAKLRDVPRRCGRQYAWIGILTIVLEGIRICMGAGAALGAAAVVVNDVPDGALVAEILYGLFPSVRAELSPHMASQRLRSPRAPYMARCGLGDGEIRVWSGRQQSAECTRI